MHFENVIIIFLSFKMNVILSLYSNIRVSHVNVNVNSQEPIYYVLRSLWRRGGKGDKGPSLLWIYIDDREGRASYRSLS